MRQPAPPKMISAEDVLSLVTHRDVVEALRTAFGQDWQMPPRWKLEFDAADGADQMYIMPAWRESGTFAVKLATIFAENNARGLPSIMASIIVMDRETGTPLALIDGTLVTSLRTAAASALGADYLARDDVRHLLVVGTGSLSPHMALAHASVRDYSRVTIWGRNTDKAEGVASALSHRMTGVDVAATGDLEAAVRRADVISCVTGSVEPLVLGDWLRPGSHLDLVGAHTPMTRECDTAAVVCARCFADVSASCLTEAGEFQIPIGEGAITDGHILGDLADLTRGTVAGREKADDITLFKSVGNAIEDAAAAELIVKKAGLVD